MIFKQQDTKKRLLNELNQFRKNPASLAPYLSQRKKNYIKDQKGLLLFSELHKNKGLKTKQGSKPISQLMGQLYARDKMPTVLQNEFLSLIASKLSEQFSTYKEMQEIKVNENMSKNIRIQLNNCTDYNFVDKITCLIGIGFDKELFQPLMGLLIDDGNSGRVNRSLMLNKNYKFVGLGTNLMINKPQLRICVYLFTTNILKK